MTRDEITDIVLWLARAATWLRPEHVTTESDLIFDLDIGEFKLFDLYQNLEDILAIEITDDDLDAVDWTRISGVVDACWTKVQQSL